MARELTRGQRSAVRAAVARRGELGMTQRELARAAAVSVRTVEAFERGRTWPTAQTLARIERLGLNWYVGKLSEMAARIDDGETTDSDEKAEIAELQQVISDARARLRALQDRRALRGMSEELRGMYDQLDRPPPDEDEPPGERPAAS